MHCSVPRLDISYFLVMAYKKVRLSTGESIKRNLVPWLVHIGLYICTTHIIVIMNCELLGNLFDSSKYTKHLLEIVYWIL